MALEVKKNYITLFFIISMVVIINLMLFNYDVFADNLTQKMKDISNKNGNYEMDLNYDGSIDIIDVALVAETVADIDIYKIRNNYVSIVNDKEQQTYESEGISFLSTMCFPVTKDGVDLFGYVNSVEGMQLELISGDNSFKIDNDKLYLIGQAPSIAKIRIRNTFGVSDEFYIYGTNDREIHDFTYDYILYLANN